jgi:hypothetical protein
MWRAIYRIWRAGASRPGTEAGATGNKQRLRTTRQRESLRGCCDADTRLHRVAEAR